MSRRDSDTRPTSAPRRTVVPVSKPRSSNYYNGGAVGNTFHRLCDF